MNIIKSDSIEVQENADKVRVGNFEVAAGGRVNHIPTCSQQILIFDTYSFILFETER
jgi:hypothetical protein